MNDSALDQLVTTPTWEKSILDLALTTDPDLISELTIVLDMSDHEAVFFTLSLFTQIPTRPTRVIYLYSRANFDTMNSELREFRDSFLFNSTNHSLDANWNKFKNFIKQPISRHIPTKVVKVGQQIPWMNHEIKVMMKKRRKLYDKARRTNNPDDWSAYKSVKNAIIKMLDSVHKSYCNT